MPAVASRRFVVPGDESILNPLGVEVGIPYTLIGPDGTRAVINDFADRDWVGILSGEDGVTGLERAGVRENADTLAGADGRIHGPFYDDGLAFTLKGLIPPASAMAPLGESTWITRQAKLLRASRARKSDGRLLWTPSEAPPVFVYFREQQPTRLTGRRPKTFIVAGVCEDPTVFSQELHTAQTVPGEVIGAGFTSPLSSPLRSELGTTVGGSLEAENIGTAEAWPVLTVYGPITNPVITNEETGQSIHLVYTLAAGEYLVIDTNPRRRSIRLNDTTNRYRAYSFAQSSWWALQPTTVNTIRLAQAAYDDGASLVVQWRDAWG